MAYNASSDLLQQQQIPDLPPKMFYIPNFITEDEEQRILDKVKRTEILAPFTCSVYLTHTADSRKPLDLSDTPPPTVNPCSTHSKQHSARFVQNATLADQPSRRSDIIFGNL